MTGRYSSEALGALRIVAGALAMLHGATRLFAFPGASPLGRAAVQSVAGAGSMIELAGGALLVAGLLTRPVAALLAANMAINYLALHAVRSPWPTLNGGELALMQCFAFLAVAGMGPGSWALDAKR